MSNDEAMMMLMGMGVALGVMAVAALVLWLISLNVHEENKEFIVEARKRLEGNWGGPIGVVAIFFGLSMVMNFIPVVNMIGPYIVGGPMSLGLILYFLKFIRRKEVTVSQIFVPFSEMDIFLKAIATYFLMFIFIMLWSFLLIVPGIMRAYSYALTFYVLADNPTLTPFEALNRSKEMMQGNRMKMFWLGCRFIGWGFLCVLTLGFGTLWLVPYMNSSFAYFYEQVRLEYEEREIGSADVFK